MDRLTIDYCGEYVPKDMCSIDRLGGADDCDLCYEYCKATEEGNEDCRECAISKCFNKLGEYEDLEEQGKLLKLPISPKTPIYSIEYCCGKNSNNKAGLCYKGRCEKCERKSYHILEATAESSCKIFEIGKTVFLTKSAAEAALKEMRE